MTGKGGNYMPRIVTKELLLSRNANENPFYKLQRSSHDLFLTLFYHAIVITITKAPKRRNRNFSDPNISLLSNFVQISIKAIRNFPNYNDFPLFKQQAYSNLPKPQKRRNEDLGNPIFASLVKHDPR